MFQRRFSTFMIATAICGVLAGFAASADACSVPVFRYGLERWAPGTYEVVIFDQGEPDAETVAAQKVLDDARVNDPFYTNIDTMIIDPATELDDERLQMYAEMYEYLGSPDETTMVVLYPFNRYGIMRFIYDVRADDIMWRGKPSKQVAERLVTSPLRKEIARHILKGESAVFVLVTSGDVVKDAAAEALLHTELAKLEEAVELPEIAEADREKYMTAAGPELRVGFTVLKLDPSNADEQMLVQMLMNMEAGLKEEKGPLVFPVYGQGRAMGAIGGEALNAETLADVAYYICGSCSCEIKDQNPGTDLLMAAGWDNFVQGTYVIDEELPPMTSLPSAAEIEAAEVTTAALAAGGGDTDKAAAAALANMPAAGDGVGAVGVSGNVVMILAAVGFLVVIAVGFVMYQKPME